VISLLIYSSIFPPNLSYRMKINKLLASVIWISLLFCFLQRTQQTEISPFLQDKTLSIKFQRPLRYGRFSFPMGFTQENKTIEALVTMDTNGLWINNNSYSALTGSKFECLESKKCHQKEEVSTQVWNRLIDGSSATTTIITDTVNFGGVTHQDFELFIVNEFEPKRFKDSASHRLGLAFKDFEESNLNILQQLQDRDVIQKSIFSIALKNSNEGELTLGGYPSHKRRSDFKFTALTGQQFGRPTLDFKALDFSSDLPNNQYGVPAILDWESPFLSLPKTYMDLIQKEIDSKGLRLNHPYPAGIPADGPDSEKPISCKALTELEDLAIQLEGFILEIPAAAYIRHGKGFNDDKESKETGCFLSVIEDGETNPYIIFGQPLFKAYDIVFDLDGKVIGFSGKYPSNANQKLSKSFLIGCVVLGIAGLGGLSYLFVKKTPKDYIPFSGSMIPFDEEIDDDEDLGQSQNVDISKSPNEEEKASP